MKTLNILLLSIFLFVANCSFGQDINWRSVNEETSHVVSAYFGADYSSYYGLSYGYVLKNKLTPIILGSELTVPFGDQPFDDWRMKLSAQGELWHKNHFSLAIKPAFIMRRYESVISRIYNLGAEITSQFGYSKEKWAVYAILNYDRAVSTHIKHDLLKEQYPNIRDGWYGSTGGNFKFGLRTSVSFKKVNTFFSIGKMYGQDFKHNPTLPFYAELALQKTF